MGRCGHCTAPTPNAASPNEVVVAIVLLAMFIPIALWVAARRYRSGRLYRSGVLLYGQAPTPRTRLRAFAGGSAPVARAAALARRGPRPYAWYTTSSRDVGWSRDLWVPKFACT